MLYRFTFPDSNTGKVQETMSVSMQQDSYEVTTASVNNHKLPFTPLIHLIRLSGRGPFQDE